MDPTQVSPHYTVIAVVGHIDHGKTALVRALTGVDTDTHPEEKRRGITIDLGFAVWRDHDDEYAFVDAPGHQKYINNLVSGVSHVDVGLLLVAADQGIQAQTLEHVAILQAIGVREMVVVISRTDLASAKATESLDEELRVFLADFGLDDFPVHRFSATSGEGLEAIKECLREHAVGERRDNELPFRMPIDRTISIPGRGCVVAGVVWNGRIKLGDTLCIPGRAVVRVRGLESHGCDVDEMRFGRRVAVNLVGISSNELHRGDELIACESYAQSQRLLVQLSMFEATSNLACPATVHLHTATLGCEARVLGVPELRNGDSAVCVIETRQPVIATHGQRFLLRRPYPVGCFGGGRVLTTLQSGVGTLKRQLMLGESLVSDDCLERLVGWIEFVGQANTSDQSLSWRLGLPLRQLDALANEAVGSRGVVAIDRGVWTGPRFLEETQNWLVRLLDETAENKGVVWRSEQSIIHRGGRTRSGAVVSWCLQQLYRKGVVVNVNGMVALATDETQLSKLQLRRLNRLLEALIGNHTPESISELAASMDVPLPSLMALVRFAEQQGLVIDIGSGWVFERSVVVRMVEGLQDLLADEDSVSVAQIRDAWGNTRKHAIPLLEFFDRIGVTVRENGQRIAGPEMSRWLSQSRKTEHSSR